MNISHYLGKQYNGKRIDGHSDWCLEFLAREGVATVMGSAFGAEGYVRLSFATSMADPGRGVRPVRDDSWPLLSDRGPTASPSALSRSRQADSATAPRWPAVQQFGRDGYATPPAT